MPELGRRLAVQDDEAVRAPGDQAALVSAARALVTVGRCAEMRLATIWWVRCTGTTTPSAAPFSSCSPQRSAMCHSSTSSRMSTPTSCPIARLRSSERDRAIARRTAPPPDPASGRSIGGEAAVEDRDARGLEDVPARAGDERLGVVGLPRVQEVAGPEELGRRPVDHADLAHDEPVRG